MRDTKWRVLIIDDEFRIGTLIRKLIHWDELSLECVCVLNDGEEAFQFLQSGKVRPDIVITDIRMPGMNGLDLISRTRELYEDMKFVVISGYKEFEYAHRALQYGVEDYLLKPISEQELNGVLEKLARALGAHKQQRLEQEQLQETVTQSRRIIKRDFLKNIIDAGEDAFQEEIPLSFEGEIYRGIDIKLDYMDYSCRDKKQDRLTMKNVSEIVERILKSVSGEVLICEKENLHLYGLFNYEYSRSKEIRGCINEILTELQNYLMGFGQYEVTIGIGRERMEFAEIRFSIMEAHRAVGNRIKLGTGRLIYADTSAAAAESEGNLSLQRQEEIRVCTESYGVEELKKTISQIYSSYLMRQEGDFSCCYDIAAELVNLFFRTFEAPEEELGELRRDILEKCAHCRSIGQLKGLLRSELGACLEAGRKSAEAEAVKPIRQARQYVEDHYSEKVMLEEVAEKVGLNAAYFSTLFKKETGVNFSVYLANVRMEKAKQLLRGTNETIAAIADHVGYKDARYFSQMFSKTVGIKPALYRKLHA